MADRPSTNMASGLTRFLILVVLCACASGKSEFDVFNPLSLLTPRQVAKLGVLREEVLPHGLRDLVRRTREAESMRTASHWCCAVNTWKELVNTKAVMGYSAGMHRQTHYRRCGWWGWSRCTVHTVRYRKLTRYSVSYNSQRVKTECPDRHVVCCKGYLLVASQCLNLADLSLYKHDIIKLKLLGLLD